MREKIQIELSELVRRIGYDIHKKEATRESENKLINQATDRILDLIPPTLSERRFNK